MAKVSLFAAADARSAGEGAAALLGGVFDETRSWASVFDETRSRGERLGRDALRGERLGRDALRGERLGRDALRGSVFIPGFVSAGNVAFFVSAGNVADASTAAGSFFLQKEACSALDPVFSHLHRLPSSGENLGFSSSGERRRRAARSPIGSPSPTPRGGELEGLEVGVTVDETSGGEVRELDGAAASDEGLRARSRRDDDDCAVVGVSEG